MHEKEIPAELLVEIERRMVVFGDRWEDSPRDRAVAEASYKSTAKYWVGRMLAERDAMQKAIEELNTAAGLFSAKQNLGGNMKEARERLSGAMWRADKVLTSLQKVADENEKASRKSKDSNL